MLKEKNLAGNASKTLADWMCRPCAYARGAEKLPDCVLCGTPWMSKAGSLGKAGMHSRKCKVCDKAFCPDCKFKHMKKTGDLVSSWTCEDCVVVQEHEHGITTLGDTTLTGEIKKNFRIGVLGHDE